MNDTPNLCPQRSWPCFLKPPTKKLQAALKSAKPSLNIPHPKMLFGIYRLQKKQQQQSCHIQGALLPFKSTSSQMAPAAVRWISPCAWVLEHWWSPWTPTRRVTGPYTVPPHSRRVSSRVIASTGKSWRSWGRPFRFLGRDPKGKILGSWSCMFFMKRCVRKGTYSTDHVVVMIVFWLWLWHFMRHSLVWEKRNRTCNYIFC